MIHIFYRKTLYLYLIGLVIDSATPFLFLLLFTSDFHTLASGFVWDGGGGDKLVLVALLEDVDEHGLETYVGLGGGFVVVDAVLLRQRFGFFLAHLAVVGQVDFVAHEHARGVLGRMGVDGLDPVAHILKSLLVGHVERNDHSVCATIKGLRQGLEALLAGCVPYLDRYLGAVVLSHIFLLREIQAERGQMCFLKLSIDVLTDHRCLAYRSITKNDYL